MTDKLTKKTETEDDINATSSTDQSKTDTAKKEKKKSSAIIEQLKSQLKEKEQEAQDNYDRFLRNAAELENYKKRTDRQMDEFRKFANESLLIELLAVVDNLERAIESSRNNKNSNGGVVEGVQMTLDEILKILDKFAVKPIDSLEKPFDPTYHQAVMQEETGDFPEQTIIREMQKGYLLHDRLLRPAMVVVSKEKTSTT